MQKLKDKIGQLLVIGFLGGEEGLDTLKSVVSRTRAGNVILFSRNTGTFEETARTVEKVKAIIGNEIGISPLVGVDQEGGIVARLRKGVTPMPGAMAMAAAVAGGKSDIGDIERIAAICGSELLSLGINWNMAPVADVNVNPANPVIGVRGFGEDPSMVSELASAFARGLAFSGVLATAKHFPGHGDTETDSHLGLPLIRHSPERLGEVELVPFRRLIKEGIDIVMIAHVRYSSIEPEQIPATMSRRVVTELLKGELGFQGIACSDCMEMKAIAGHFPDAAKKAIAAGMDLIIVSHSAEAQIAAADSIFEAVLAGEIPESRIDEAVARVSLAKEKLRFSTATARNGLQHQSARQNIAGDSYALARKISRASLSLLVGGEAFPPQKGSFIVDIRPETLTDVEDGDRALGVAESLRRLGSPMSIETAEAKLSTTDSEEVLKKVERSIMADKELNPELRPSLVLCLHAPLVSEGQMVLVEKAARFSARSNVPLGLVLMRSPYDARQLSDLVHASGAARPAILCAYEYSGLSSESVADFLVGRCDALGKCPVTVF
jgi:beta-N-acetylhexosaminidase